MAKAVTLKNTSDEEVYPVTDLSLVNGNIPSSRLDWSTINSSSGDFNNILVRGNVNISWETNLNNIGSIFNSAYKDGYYAFNSYSGSSAGTGQPGDRVIGMMLVTSSSAWNVCSQTIYTANAIYIRRYSDGAWGSWNKIVNTQSTDWVYLGQTRLTAPASSLTFVFPKKYDNYKVIFGGELSSGSNTWNDFRFYNGATALTLDFQVQDVTNGADYYGTSTNVSYAINGNASQYDTINLELYSVKTASSQWRKYQGTIDMTGSVWRVRRHSGRLNSNTEPDRVTMITGGAYGTGAVLKVWGSNNT